MSMKLDNIVAAVNEAQTKAKKRKFEEAMEVIVNLKGIDLKKGGKQLNVDVNLPHASGEGTKICIIGSGNFAFRAREAGASRVLEVEDIERIETDKDAGKALAEEMDFFIAQADLMPLIGRVLGPFLGPRGKMPRPAPPDVDLKKMLSEFSSSVKISMRKNLVIQAKVGQRSMESKLIAENIQAIVTALERNLEKGMQNIDAIFTKTTMGPAIKIAM
ncbi:MAG: 50S ribosomal protein L1 [Candidatus Hermodarchaeota archaeon]|nr:50S ribosomal protein L1 [Candidatus Hermodarchaeota archaeon]